MLYDAMEMEVGARCRQKIFQKNQPNEAKINLTCCCHF